MHRPLERRALSDVGRDVTWSVSKAVRSPEEDVTAAEERRQLMFECLPRQRRTVAVKKEKNLRIPRIQQSHRRLWISELDERRPRGVAHRQVTCECTCAARAHDVAAAPEEIALHSGVLGVRWGAWMRRTGSRIVEHAEPQRDGLTWRQV